MHGKFELLFLGKASSHSTALPSFFCFSFLLFLCAVFSCFLTTGCDAYFLRQIDMGSLTCGYILGACRILKGRNPHILREREGERQRQRQRQRRTERERTHLNQRFFQINWKPPLRLLGDVFLAYKLLVCKTIRTAKGWRKCFQKPKLWALPSWVSRCTRLLVFQVGSGGAVAGNCGVGGRVPVVCAGCNTRAVVYWTVSLSGALCNCHRCLVLDGAGSFPCPGGFKGPVRPQQRPLSHPGGVEGLENYNF